MNLLAGELDGSNGGPMVAFDQGRETRAATVQDRIEEIRKMMQEEEE